MSYHLPEPFSLESILPEQCVDHQEGSRVRMIGQRQPGSLPHHHKTQDCKPHDLAVLLGSLSLLLSTRVPLPNKVSCFVAGVSLWTIHFRVLDKSPLLGTEGVLLPAILGSFWRNLRVLAQGNGDCRPLELRETLLRAQMSSFFMRRKGLL